MQMFFKKKIINPAGEEQELVKFRASNGVAVASHGQVQDFFMEVRLCIYEVKQIQKAAVFFIMIPYQAKGKHFKMISETKLLI